MLRSNEVPFPPATPLDITGSYVESFGPWGSPQDQAKLAELNRSLVLADVHGTYVTHAYRGIVRSIGLKTGQGDRDFNEIAFIGDFLAASLVIIGRNIGTTTIRALCLSFDTAVLLSPDYTLSADKCLHVPVLAVDSMHGPFKGTTR